MSHDAFLEEMIEVSRLDLPIHAMQMLYTHNLALALWVSFKHQTVFKTLIRGASL